MATKRELERRLADLEAQNRTAAPEDDPERIELYLNGLYMYEPEPELTNDLQSCGFVVERDVQDYADGGTVLLQTTPSAADISATISWYYDGPTADLNDVRIVWETDRLEQVRADAEHPTVYAEPDVPAETERTVIDEGEGWAAVVPSDRVITNTVERRGNAEHRSHEILGPVELRWRTPTSTTSSKSMPIPIRIARGVRTSEGGCRATRNASRTGAKWGELFMERGARVSWPVGRG